MDKDYYSKPDLGRDFIISDADEDDKIDFLKFIIYNNTKMIYWRLCMGESNEGKNENVKKSKKGLKIKLILLFILLLAIVGGICYIRFAPKTIDLTKYIEISYDGYEGNAKATASLNEDEIKKIIKDKDIAEELIDELKIEIKNNSKLSNGDEIEINLKISDDFLKENKLKLKDSTYKVKVEGLDQVSRIDLSKYVELELDGFNGHASAEVNLSKDLKEVIGNDNFKDLEKVISFNIINNGELENDGTAEIEISLSDSWQKEHGIEIKKDKIEVDVTGLEEGVEIDAFASMKVELTGMSPNITLDVRNTSEDDFIKTVVFTPEKKSNITNGETIKISITSYDKKIAEEKGYVFKETSTDYKVNNQAAYISNVNEINDNIKNEIKTLYIDKAKSKATELYRRRELAKAKIEDYTDYKYTTVDDSGKDLQIGNPEVVSLYLLTKKDDTSNKDKNKVIGIVKIPYTSNQTGTTYNWFVTVVAANFSTTSDGKVSDNAVYTVTVEYGKDQEEAYQKWINSEKDYYNVENIPVK